MPKQPAFANHAEPTTARVRGRFWSLVARPWSFFRHSTFVIRHFSAYLGVSVVICLATIAIGLPISRSEEPAVKDSTATDSATVAGSESPKSKTAKPRDAATINAAIERGVHFLLGNQNKDGSWGSADNTTGEDVYAPIPGAHQAFRAAVTALAISALIEVGGDSADVQKSLDRGETWLLEKLPKVRRAEPEALYNVWTHSYGISALVYMLKRHPDDAARADKIKQLIRGQFAMLQRYECVDGGWDYYDTRAHAEQPGGDALSFCAATGIIAMHEAKDVGIDPPQKMIDKAIASILRQQKPDFSYYYGEYLQWYPMMPINRPGGSLGRSQACNLALRLWGDKRITDDVMNSWLDRLFNRNLWLDLGRKRPIPHESYFQVAGYFYYYGHYYAARCVEELPNLSDRNRHYDQLTQLILKVQEKDGSWWDFPLYNYHQQYGTSFALMTLGRCRPEK
jgi:hypothetical protein